MTLYTFVHNLLHVLEQIANKMELQKNIHKPKVQQSVRKMSLLFALKPDESYSDLHVLLLQVQSLLVPRSADTRFISHVAHPSSLWAVSWWARGPTTVFRFPTGARNFAPFHSIQTGYGVHPVKFLVGSGSRSWLLIFFSISLYISSPEVKSDGQSASQSWCQTPLPDPRPISLPFSNYY
jgi:hypothetical protein